MSDWAFNLDNLAANGVIDFDAPAFLLDKKPRYIGNPSLEELPLESPMYLPEGVKLKDLPSVDTFGNPEDKNLVSNPLWKKVLFGAIALGAAVAGTIGIFKFKGGLKNIKKSFSKFISNIKMPSLEKIGHTMKSWLSSAWNIIKKPFKK